MSSKAPTAAGQPELPTEAELEARARELFELWGVIDTLAHVEVLFNDRLRTTAGRARLRTIRIELNPHILARVPDRVDEVLVHEAAHLATAILHPRSRHHGPEWTGLMRQAGYPPGRRAATHDFPIDGLRRG